MTQHTADQRTMHAIAAALAGEYRMVEEAARQGDVPLAWHHLGRAHILAKTRLGPHCVSHWRMFAFAVRLRDWPESAGQLLRLLLAPIGNLTGLLPIGNTGRQLLEDNPFRIRSRPYLHLGVLGEISLGRFSLFANAENLLHVRQSLTDPLPRTQRAPSGQWTVDAWAPLEGFVLNSGVRLQFGGA